MERLIETLQGGDECSICMEQVGDGGNGVRMVWLYNE